MPVNKNSLVEVLKNILLLAFSIFLAIDAVEAGFRIFKPDRGGELIAISFSKGFVKKDADVGLVGIPFATGICYNCETKVGYHLNSKGFRDSEHSLAKKEGRYRILLMGDSFVWGVGVEQDATFARLLADKYPALEIINTSVPGWSTCSEYFYLKEYGLLYRPDMVIVVLFVGNDAVDNGNYERSGFGDYANPFAENKEHKLFSFKWFQDHSRIFRIWKRMRKDLKIKWGLTPVFTEYSGDSIGWRSTVKWIDKLKEITDENGIQLLMVLAPDRTQFFLKKYPDRPQRMLKQVLEEKGVRYLDLYPAFLDYRKSRRPDWGYFKYDGHWDKSGHEIVARLIYDFINSPNRFISRNRNRL